MDGVHRCVIVAFGMIEMAKGMLSASALLREVFLFWSKASLSG